MLHLPTKIIFLTPHISDFNLENYNYCRRKGKWAPQLWTYHECCNYFGPWAWHEGNGESHAGHKIKGKSPTFQISGLTQILHVADFIVKTMYEPHCFICNELFQEGSIMCFKGSNHDGPWSQWQCLSSVRLGMVV